MKLRIIGWNTTLFAIVAVIVLGVLCQDTSIDGAIFATCFLALVTLMGGRKYLNSKNSQNGVQDGN